MRVFIVGHSHFRQGYVEFGSTEEATEALKKSQNLVIGIRRLNVEFASPASVIPHQERAKVLVSTCKFSKYINIEVP